MQILKDYWPVFLFILGVMAAAIKLRNDMESVKAHIKSHCEDLDKITAALNAHLTSGTHYTIYDREAAKEYREQMADRLDGLQQGQEKIMRHLLRQKFPEGE